MKVQREEFRAESVEQSVRGEGNRDTDEDSVYEGERRMRGCAQ